MKVSSKRLAIDKDQARIVVTVVAAAAITVFCLIGSSTLITKLNHQNDVISALEDSKETVQENISNLNALTTTYNNFENSVESVIGDNDSNSKVVLDALPSKYDFAALLTSMEAILRTGNYTTSGISGTDNELTAEQSSANPEPVEIPLSLAVNTTYAGSQQLLDTLASSIRPFDIRSMRLSGGDADARLNLELITYYQPSKEVQFGERTIK
ncbi:MAG: hypothetical protein AAF413_03790 [Patescibacteria group bacterium]